MPEQAVLELVVKDQGSGNVARLQLSLEGLKEAGLGAEHKLLDLEAATELATKAFDLLKETGEALLDKFEEFENVSKVFELKEGKVGVENLEEMLAAMKDVGIAASDAESIAKKLGTEFDSKSAKELAGIVADVRGNLRLTNDETKAVADSFVALGARATVGAKQVRSMEHLFGGKDVATEIAKATGQSIAKVTAELKKSTLPTDQLVKGLRQAQFDIAGVSSTGAAAQKSAAGSVEDQIGRLKNVVSDFGETLARDLFGGGDAAEGIKNFADKLKTFLESKDVKDFLLDVASAMKEIGKVAGGLLLTALHGLESAFKGLKAGYDFLTSGSDNAKTALAGLAGVITGAVILALIAVVPPALAAAGAFIAAAAVPLLVVGAFAILGVAIYQLVAHWDELGEGITLIGHDLWAFIRGVWASFTESIANAAATVINGFKSALEWLGNLPGKMYDAGANAIRGLLDGIKSLAHAPIEAVKGIAQGIAHAFTSALGISSPSVVFMKAGANVAKGAKLGIEGGTPDVVGASQDMAVASYGPMSKKSPEGGGGPDKASVGASGGGGNVYIEMPVTVHAGGVTGHEVATDVISEIEQGLRVIVTRFQQQGML